MNGQLLVFTLSPKKEDPWLDINHRNKRQNLIMPALTLDESPGNITSESRIKSMKEIVAEIVICFNQVKKKDPSIDKLIYRMSTCESFEKYDAHFKILADVSPPSKRRISKCRFCKQVKVNSNSWQAANCNRCKYCPVCYQFIMDHLEGKPFTHCFTKIVGKIRNNGKSVDCAKRKKG